MNSDNWVGQHLGNGRFHVTGVAGEGGMGVIYRATDTQTGEDVVVKSPQQQFSSDEVVQRFLREVRSLQKLAHPAIVRIIDAGEHNGRPFVTLQYLSGGTLIDRQKDEHGRVVPMTVGALKSWLPRMASALDFMHAQTYVHRDVKPVNIMFDGQGQSFLSDFGLAKALVVSGADQSVAFQTASGQVLGTPAYMAPELLLDRDLDGRADQYALALTAYEMLAGGHPLAGMAMGKVYIFQTGPEEYAPLHQIHRSIPKEASEAIGRAASKDKEKRFKTCLDFARALFGMADLSEYLVDHASTRVPPQPLPGTQRQVTQGVATQRPPTPAPPAPGPAPTANGVGAPAPEKVHFPCSNCGQTLRMAVKYRGQMVQCPSCQKPVRVPTDGQAPPPPAPGEDVKLPCPGCGQVLRIRPEARGGQVRCGGCQAVLTVASDGTSLRAANVAQPPAPQPPPAPEPPRTYEPPQPEPEEDEGGAPPAWRDQRPPSGGISWAVVGFVLVLIGALAAAGYWFFLRG